MINPESPTPLYIQIKDYILLQIQSGAYAPATRIPSERQLAQEFKVSRLTVSKAVQELVRDGYLMAQVGKGTFVNNHTIDARLDSLTSFTEDMTRRGQTTRSRVLYSETIAAPEPVARHLNIDPGVEIVALHRVRMADNYPLALEKSSILASLCPGILEKHDFATASLYHVLRSEYGIHMTYAEQTIEARRASPDEAEALKIVAESPVLQISRVTCMANDRPFEYVRSAYRGDKYKFRAILRNL